MNKKLLIIFNGNEGSSYLTNKLSKFNSLYDLGYEVFDKHNYKNKSSNPNIDEDEIKEYFTRDFKEYYNRDYKEKIPFCKCRIFKYYTDSNNYDKQHIFKVINENKITHIILIYRIEFDNIIRKFYFKNNPPTNVIVDNSKSELSLGQFNPKRNELFNSLKETFTIDKNIFEFSFKQKIEELKKKHHHYKLIQEFTNCKIMTIEYNNLISMNDDDFIFTIEKFIGNKLHYNSNSELLSMKIDNKNFEWIHLFDKESKEYLETKKEQYYDLIKHLLL